MYLLFKYTMTVTGPDDSWSDGSISVYACVCVCAYRRVIIQVHVDTYDTCTYYSNTP
jgi:hypothetical protein